MPTKKRRGVKHYTYKKKDYKFNFETSKASESEIDFFKRSPYNKSYGRQFDWEQMEAEEKCGSEIYYNMLINFIDNYPAHDVGILALVLWKNLSRHMERHQGFTTEQQIKCIRELEDADEAHSRAYDEWMFTDKPEYESEE